MKIGSRVERVKYAPARLRDSVLATIRKGENRLKHARVM